MSVLQSMVDTLQEFLRESAWGFVVLGLSPKGLYALPEVVIYDSESD